MIRIFVITMLTTIVISSCDASKEVDPLFYQISEADSTRCMDEILDDIVEDTTRIHSILGHIYRPGIPFCGLVDKLGISINSSGEVMINHHIDHHIDSNNIVEKTFMFFMCNRELTSKELMSCATDVNCPGFEFPFYDSYNKKEILRILKESHIQLDEMKTAEGLDQEWVERRAERLKEWKALKNAIEIIDAPTIPQISNSAHVRFEYQRASPKSKEVLNQIAFAFYQMRNFECLKYFNETYLSLYDRAQRKKRKIDLDKLEVLKVLHPASIYAVHRNDKKERAWQVVASIPR
jgi:hypothetical protein